jgi:hypothetical protein
LNRIEDRGPIKIAKEGQESKRKPDQRDLKGDVLETKLHTGEDEI